MRTLGMENFSNFSFGIKNRIMKMNDYDIRIKVCVQRFLLANLDFIM